MGRLACISVDRLALQILLRRLPGTEPVAVVREDRPSSPLVHVNRKAADRGLRPGMRYSEALALVSELKAFTVSAHEIQAAQNEILDVLAKWSPVLEVCPNDAGSVWAQTTGLTSLYGSEAQWGAGVRQALKHLGYRAVIVIGNTRGATLVLARSRRRSSVLGSPEAEQEALSQAPLSEVPLEARHRRLLEKLGIRRFGQLAALSPDDLARRFGSELVQALQTFQAFNVLPLQPVHRDPAPGVGCQLEAPVSDRSLLLPVIRDLLTPVLERLLRQGRLLAELRLEFALETWASSVTPARLVEVLRPAAPTNDPKGWNKLVDLRLSQGEFPAAVLEVHLTFSEVDPPPGSGELFAAPQSRDLHRGAQALALIRAQWGNDSVVRPLLLESHLPEGSFRWEEIGLLRPPKRKAPAAMLENHALEMPVPVSAIRRVFRPLARRAGPCAGERLAGPYRLSQPTCNGVAVDREYWFLRTKSLEVQWVAYNRLTSTSELTGMVD